jgi:hypothetical protein
LSSSTLVSLSSSFAFSSSTSFDDAEADAVPVGLVVVLEAPGDAEIVESLFFASATGPPLLDGFKIGAERLAEAEALVLPVALVLVLDVAGFTAGFGLEVLVVPAGLLTAVVDEVAAPRFSASVSGFTGELLDPVGAREVLLAAAARGFFFSSPDPPIEAVDLCPALEDVGAVALLAGFRTTEPAAGRVGGLLNPPVVLVDWAAEEDVVGFVADDVDAPGRLAAATPGRFGGTFSFFAPFAVSLA